MNSSNLDDASAQRLAAQKRVDRIAQFREELSALEHEHALNLTPEQRARLEAHLHDLTSALVRTHGIDATESARRTSWAMRLTALLGGVAVFAALVLLLHRVWGAVPNRMQPVLLAAFPLVLLTGAAWLRKRHSDPFFTTLLALSAGAGFVMELTAMGTIHNSPGSPHAVLGWSVFGLLVAYALKSRLLLAAGLLFLCAYASALGQLFSGGWWPAWLERPVWMIPTAALVYTFPAWLQRPDPHRLAVVFRACGAATGSLALLIFSFTGHFCCLGLSTQTGETLVQIIGLGLATGILGHGLRLREPSTVNLGAVAFVTFLLVRLHSWCWDWMPKYAFLFMVGMLAVVLLLVFRRLRLRTLKEPAPALRAAESGTPSTATADIASSDTLPSDHTTRLRARGLIPTVLLAAAAAVVLLSNLWVLVTSATNRHQDAGGVLDLTEDELAWVPRLGESTVNLLEFRWRTSEEEQRQRPRWLDAAKLASLGYDCSIPLSAATAADHYRRLGHRPAWLVLTISDPLIPPGSDPQAPPTRLTIVDAGPAAAPLREQYPDPDRYALVPGVVHLRYLDPPRASNDPQRVVRLQGEVVTVLPPQLFVPRPFTARLDQLLERPGERQDRAGSSPRFRVKVAWGSQHTPWLKDLQTVTPPGRASEATLE